MATLLLTTVGTLVGGPIGGAIGAFAGQQIDSSIFGAGSYEGPRLKELSVTTSSYGQPLPHHFGRMRVAGTVIWSTDLKESRETNGGGKGKPKTTTYSYSASFAVALSGRPIHDIGRIWADGDLLRGAAGDLKAGGQLRIYTGRQDQSVDPLIAGAEGASCPAFRDCAYVVFEDLQLGDFGNRIPALTFEVDADEIPQVDLTQIVQSDLDRQDPVILPHLLGFSNEGGSISNSLQVLDQLFPLDCREREHHPFCSLESGPSGEVVTLPPPIAWPHEESGRSAVIFEQQRVAKARPQPRALRYYEPERDFQPGVQRSQGMPATGRELMLQFPGALAANDARALCSLAAQRSRWNSERVKWRIAQVDDNLGPGTIVQLTGLPGIWSIDQWEWLDRGVELQLERLISNAEVNAVGESGRSNPPLDVQTPATILSAFELPWDGTGSAQDPQFFAAATAETDGWRGAYLYVERADGLIGLGPANGQRATVGSLVTILSTSPATHLERSASFEVELLGSDLSFSDTTIDGIAAGENRLLVGGEVLQFLWAEQVSDVRWKLCGLLRGRGGTEHLAAIPHGSGTRVILIDDGLTSLDPGQVPSIEGTRIAAIGLGDHDPVLAEITSLGATRRPLAPVHVRHEWDEAGNLSMCWTRRSRGQWQWNDFVDTPVIEEGLRFVVGFGPTDAPHVEWEVEETQFSLSSAVLADLVNSYGAGPLHVSQIGTYARSPASLIAALA